MSSAAVQFCTFCSKPFAESSSYKRHVAYCRKVQSKMRKRLHACLNCNRAKAKCSFHSRCVRCTDKGLECVYGSRQVEHKHPAWQSVENDFLLSLSEVTNDCSELGTLSTEDIGAPNRTDHFQSFNTGAQPFEYGWYGPLRSDYRSLQSLERNLNVRTGVGSLERLRGGSLVAERSISVLIRALCALPEQMLRRDTLPFFIHPSWHLEELPEPIVVCMKIAQLFASRTPGIMPFLWGTIRAEQLRVAEDDTLSIKDLFAASQVQLVYIMMRVTEGTTEPSGYNQEMLVLSNVICTRYLSASHEAFCNAESSFPSRSTEEWIYAESRRRTACVWFLMSQVLSLSTGQPCDAMENFLTLPLPSSGHQWAKGAVSPLTDSPSDAAGPDVYTLGNLLQTHKNNADAEVVRQLGSWRAQIDELGMLLNLTAAML